jgi:hypothetical protein
MHLNPLSSSCGPAQVRPRQATLLDDFRTRVLYIIPTLPERMHIIQGESVRDWILASDIVVSSYSTSLIEAAIADKPVYILVPYPIPSSLDQEWHRLVPQVLTLAEFLDIYATNSNIGGNNRLQEWAWAAMLAHGDPILNLAHLLSQICWRQVPLPSVPSKATITSLNGARLPAALLCEYRKFRLDLAARQSAQPREIPLEYQYDVACQDEVEHRVQKWGQILASYAETKGRQ